MFIKFQPQFAVLGDVHVPAAERFDKDIPLLSVWHDGQTKWVPDSLTNGKRSLTEILLANSDFVEVTPQERT